MQQSKVIRVLLAGPPGVGKTCLVTRFMKGEFLKNHIPSIDKTRHEVSFNTNVGRIVMDVVEKQTITRDDYSNFDDVVCIMKPDDVFAFPRHMPQNIWYVVGGNARCKADEINIKTNENIEKLFLEIAKHVLKNGDIDYVPEVAKIPPEAIVPKDVEEKIKEMLKFPEDDSDE